MPHHLVELLLPLYDNQGSRFSDEDFRSVNKELVDRFGGVTAFTRTPVEGWWKSGQQQQQQQQPQEEKQKASPSVSPCCGRVGAFDGDEPEEFRTSTPTSIETKTTVTTTQVKKDDSILVEVITETLDKEWWGGFRKRMEAKFRQDCLLIRTHPIETL